MRPSATAYFAIFMSSLDAKTEDDQENEMENGEEEGESMESKESSSTRDERTKSATLNLLASIFSKVPKAVVKAKTSEIGSLFLKLYQNYSSTNSPNFIKALVGCIGKLVEGQEDSTLWQSNEIIQLFKIVLSFVTDERPKVRNAASHSLVSILSSCPSSSVKSKLGSSVTSFANQLFQSKESEKVRGSMSSAVSKEGIHFLSSSAGFVNLLPSNSVKSLTEALLSLPTLSQPQVTLLLMNYLTALAAPLDESPTQKDQLNADFFVQLLGPLYNMQFNSSDNKGTIAFVDAVASIYLRIAQLDSTKALDKLPKVISKLFSTFSAESDDVVSNSEAALKKIIEGMDEKWIQTSKLSISSGVNKEGSTPLEQAIHTVQTALKPLYKRNWIPILRVQSALFEKLGSASFPLLKNLTKSLGELYGKEESVEDPELQAALTETLGNASAFMGPKNFLSVLPLNLNLEKGESLTAWLLPLMADNLYNCELAFFKSYFLGIANKMKENAEEALAEGKPTAHKNMHVIWAQIWDLFPGFCNYPIDVPESFKGIAQVLGQTITDEPHIRGVICAGLSRLIKQSRSAKNGENLEKGIYTPQQGEKNIKAIAVFCKNFVPCLFNVFVTSEDASEKAITLNCVEEFVSIADPKTVTAQFKDVVTKFLSLDSAPSKAKAKKKKSAEEDLMEEDEEEEDPEKRTKRIEFTEMMSPFIPYLDNENVAFLFKVIRPHLESKDSLMQKKAFKLLALMCKNHSSFVASKSDQLKSVISETLGSCTAGAKKGRLRCLEHIVPHLPESTLTEVMGDIIVCVKEVNVKTRQAALNVILSLAQIKKEENPKKGVMNFIEMMAAGLAGTSPHMTSATIDAMSRIVFDFCSDLPAEFQALLLTPIATCLQLRSREIMKSALEFIKVAVIVMDQDVIQSHLETIMGNIAKLNKSDRFHAKSLLRTLYVKLIRKFGLEEITKYTLPEDSRLFAHIRKAELKKKKETSKDEGKSKRAQAAENRKPASFEEALYGSEDEEDLSDAEDSNERKAPRSRLIENSDEPMDLSDLKSMRNIVVGSKKEIMEKNASLIDGNEELIFDKNGRIIVKDAKRKVRKGASELLEDIIEEEDNESKPMPKKKRKYEDDEREDLNHPSENLEENNSANKRGKNVPLKAKKAKVSDNKKAGRIEPFAYHPLDPKLLNKRTNKRASGQFKSIVAAAKRGSQTKSNGHKRR
eukprot:TRINITY_DN3958_c1_g1_i1.p1 TRINITY_DN3958_c1_g1~~TRINITY_DN3958_c1_g1_i1.p1  ORF type:complete len:1269 (+),score=538.45 TRINITY_DN3958_c1_g1_i1:183-3809(+)